MFNRLKDFKDKRTTRRRITRFNLNDQSKEELIELSKVDEEEEDENNSIQSSSSEEGEKLDIDKLNGYKISRRPTIGSPIGSLSVENPGDYREFDYRLLKYFMQLPGKNVFAFQYVDGLFQISDINIRDDYGQSLLHEIARDWHTDIAQFLYDRGIKIDVADDYGRTPLIVASACDNASMVSWLITNGADIKKKARGIEEYQAIHFASAYDAPKVLHTLIEFGADPDQRDGLEQTPLFLAAKSGAYRTCKMLLDLEVPVGTYTKYGSTPLEMIVNNMKTELAFKALDQCLLTNKQTNLDQYYLSSLTKKRWKIISDAKRIPREKKTTCTVIEKIVEKMDLALIEHPVIQQYIKEMSLVYGNFYLILCLIANIVFTALWTVHSSMHNLSSVGKRDTDIMFGARIALTIILTTMTIMFTIKLYWEYKLSYKRWLKLNTAATSCFITRRKTCHPTWEKESRFFDKELDQIESDTLEFWRDGWVFMEILTLLACYVNIIISVIKLILPQGSNVHMEKVHIYYSVVFLILIWLHLNRSLLVYQSIGPFVTILVYSTRAVVQFAFLFCEFFIPFVCIFWVFFGGNRTKQNDGPYEITGEYRTFNDVIYQLYLITIVGDYVADDLWAINVVIGEVVLSVYFILVSIICMNIYIALLTDVFTTMISVAMATVSWNKTKAMLMFEIIFPSVRDKMEDYLLKNCSPLIRPVGHGRKAKDDGSILDVLNHVGQESRKLRLMLKEMNETQKQLQKEMESIIKIFDGFMVKFPTKKFYETKQSLGRMNEYLSSRWYDLKIRFSRALNG